MSKQYFAFCPFCGVEVARFYKDSFAELPHLTQEEP